MNQDSNEKKDNKGTKKNNLLLVEAQDFIKKLELADSQIS